MKNYITLFLKYIIQTEDHEIRELVKTKSRIITFKKREKIKRDGDPITEIFICVKGIFKCIHYGPDGKEYLKSSNIGGDIYGIILNPEFNLMDNNRFSGDCIAATACTVVAIPLDLVVYLYKNNPALKDIITEIYRRMMIYYSKLTTLQNLDGLERYYELKNFSRNKWKELSNQDKALFMNMEYSYWMKFRKKYDLE